MKAILAFALLGYAAATLPTFHPNYIKLNTETFQCEIQPGYVFTFHSDNIMAIADATPPDVTFAGAVTTDTTDPATATACIGVASQIAFVTCATGYHAHAVVKGQKGAFAAASATEWGASMITDADAAVWETPYDFSTDVFECHANTVRPVGCSYNCTGGGCINSSGFVANGTDFSTVCNAQYVDVADIEACPASGLNTTTTIVCSNDPAVVPASKWFALAQQFPGYSIPNKCGCLTDPVCPDFITCSQCYLSCSETHTPPHSDAHSDTHSDSHSDAHSDDHSHSHSHRHDDTHSHSRAQKRQSVSAAAVFCDASTATIAEMRACFEAGACAGAIQPGDTCVYGPFGSGVSPCPECPEGSKKGLLGLLGLLGLIPLILCLLCCSLLLCLIRRKKKERDVHFATFDAGAPAVLAPCAEVAPIVLTHSQVHHATYVGAPHVATASGYIA